MDPEKPLPSDCCGNGCSPCVFDIYEEHMKSITKGQENSNKLLSRTDLLSKTRFKPFRLIEKHKVTEDVFLLRFQAVESLESGDNKHSKVMGILPYDIGQHLFVRYYFNQPSESETQQELEEDTQSMIRKIKERFHNEPENKQMVIRAYTPITLSTLEKNCCFDVIVKRYENGLASVFLSQSTVGDIRYWRGPCGTFHLKSQSFDYILMTCVGTGLAPMIPIINAILNDESDETLIHLMFGVKNINSIILREELRKFSLYWNFSMEYFFSESTKLNENIKFGEVVNHSKIDYSSVNDFILGKNLEKLLVLVCGTESFTLSMTNILCELGVDISKNVHIFS